jgi:hypothetical protein
MIHLVNIPEAMDRSTSICFVFSRSIIAAKTSVADRFDKGLSQRRSGLTTAYLLIGGGGSGLFWIPLSTSIT